MKSKKYTLYSSETYNQVMKIRRKYGWGIIKIREFMSNNNIELTKGVIGGWIYRNNHLFTERIVTRIPESSKELSYKKAYILGVLCGDGYISTGYRIGLSVCDEEFADYFKNCIEEIYQVKCSKTLRLRKSTNFCENPKASYNISAVSKSVVEDLQRYSPTFKSKFWDLPVQVKTSSLTIKSSFLQGLYDSEAHVRFRKGQSEINLCSGNIKSLLQVKEILEKDFQIQSYSGTNGSKVGVIVITRYDSLLKFQSSIGFIIKRKQHALNNALNSYKRKGINRFSEEFKLNAVDMLKKGLKHKEIAKIVGTNSTNIYDWEKRYAPK